MKTASQDSACTAFRLFRLAPAIRLKIYFWLLLSLVFFFFDAKEAAFASSNADDFGFRGVVDYHRGRESVSRSPLVPQDCYMFHVFETNATLFSFYHCPLSTKFIVSASKSKHNVFLLRLVGNRQMSTTISERIDERTYSIKYRILHHGIYKAFIRIMMNNEVYDPLNNCLANYVHINHEFEVLEELDAHLVVAAHEARHDESCCWEFEPPLNEEEMLQHKGWDMHSPWKSELAFRLKFSKASNEKSPEEARGCLREKTICFFGDSHTRHLFDAMNKLINASSEAACDKQSNLCHGEVGMYVVMHYPSAFPDLNLSSCTHLIYNYGQWPAAHTDEPVWSIERYERETRHFFDNTLATIAQEKKVFWMSSNPFPLTLAVVLSCPPTDWRFPHILKEYNTVAAVLARERGIEVIDHFDMMFHLVDASYDAAHYTEPSGSALARLVLTRLCSSL